MLRLGPSSTNPLTAQHFKDQLERAELNHLLRSVDKHSRESLWHQLIHHYRIFDLNSAGMDLR